MQHIQKFEQHSSYNVGDVLIAKHNYIDLYKKDQEYEIVSTEDVLGETMYYVSNNGRKITQWPLKKFEMDINFRLK